MEKIRLTELLIESELKKCKLSAPMYFLDGCLFDDMIKSPLLISSDYQSDFHRSSASVSFDYYKPISKPLL